MDICIHNSGVPYRPHGWNGFQENLTNCYSYATLFPYEWLLPGSFCRNEPWKFYMRNSARTGLDYNTLDGLRTALLHDGVRPLPATSPNKVPRAPDGHFIMAAALDPTRDFHFYLYHGRAWSHKVGWRPVCMRHESKDPRRYCADDGYPDFVGFYAVSADLVVQRARDMENDSPHANSVTLAGVLSPTAEPEADSTMRWF